MTEDTFWHLIEKSRRGNARDCDAQAAKLTALLERLPPAEIAAFDRMLSARRNECYRWDLWAAAFIVNGGCSDDGFEYFRLWLIGQGHEFYHAVLADPQAVARRVHQEDVECEELLYAANAAYQNATGQQMPDPDEILILAEPSGEPWHEDDLPRLFPKLWARF